MVTLIVLDGFGIRKEKYGNAIKCAGTPNLDKLIKKYPHTQLDASGEAVGQPAGLMGGSEVGHLTMGTGRANAQPIVKINNEIKNGQFFENKALKKALNYAEKSGRLHLMGLFSNIGVHAMLDHAFAILKAAKNKKIKDIYFHAFTDGRDCGINDAVKYLDVFYDFLQKNDIKNVKIASLTGRAIAMDREKRWGRIEKTYKMLTSGKYYKNCTPIQALQQSYNAGITDEFLEPVLLEKDGKIKDGDSVIFYNFRSDRGREITDAFTGDNFKGFKRKKLDILFTPMFEYDEKFKHLNTFYHQIRINDNLAHYISKAGLKQFHTSETTKYAHVTFYFNGQIEKPYKNEDRVLIDSIDVEDFSAYPKMRAIEITEQVLKAISSKKYAFILVNFSNPDMIGHTGNFRSAVEAIKCVDQQAAKVAMATLNCGGDCIITADHGNAELMFDKKGNKITSHTTNPVPCILISEKHKKAKLAKGKTIASISSTVLKLLNLPLPENMASPLF